MDHSLSQWATLSGAKVRRFEKAPCPFSRATRHPHSPNGLVPAAAGYLSDTYVYHFPDGIRECRPDARIFMRSPSLVHGEEMAPKSQNTRVLRAVIEDRWLEPRPSPSAITRRKAGTKLTAYCGMRAHHTPAMYYLFLASGALNVWDFRKG